MPQCYLTCTLYVLLGVNGRLACLCVEGHGHGIVLYNVSAFTGCTDENLVTYQPEQEVVVTSFIYLPLMHTIYKPVTLKL